MLNRNKATRFAVLLERQADGDPGALDAAFGLGITLDDGYSLFNLYEEYAAAFKSWPGRAEALPPLLALARKLAEYDTDDTSRLFQEAEWGKLVALRAPAEAVMLKKCSGCAHQYVSIITGDFYDGAGLVCSHCGDVYFKSYYDHTCCPCPNCGATLPGLDDTGCPECSCAEFKVTGMSTPYQYFRSHGFKRGPGA